MRRPLVIALTGGIGAGKSLALKIFSRKGFPVLQTDKIGHRLLLNNEVKKRIIKYFEKDVLGEDGEISRRKLAKKVFSDPKRQRVINRIFHKTIRKKVKKWVGSQIGSFLELPFLIVEVPLVFEGGYYRWFDGILCISAPRSVRRKRLLRRGWSYFETLQRERLQWPQPRKDVMANWILYNKRTRKSLVSQVENWLKETANSFDL